MCEWDNGRGYDGLSVAHIVEQPRGIGRAVRLLGDRDNRVLIRCNQKTCKIARERLPRNARPLAKRFAAKLPEASGAAAADMRDMQRGTKPSPRARRRAVVGRNAE